MRGALSRCRQSLGTEETKMAKYSAFKLKGLGPSLRPNRSGWMHDPVPPPPTTKFGQRIHRQGGNLKEIRQRETESGPWAPSGSALESSKEQIPAPRCPPQCLHKDSP